MRDGWPCSLCESSGSPQRIRMLPHRSSVQNRTFKLIKNARLPARNELFNRRLPQTRGHGVNQQVLPGGDQSRDASHANDQPRPKLTECCT